MKVRILSFLLCSFFVLHSPVQAARSLPPVIGETQPQLSDRIALIMNGMSLEEKVAQLFIIAADDGAMNTPLPVGGFILFSRHTQNRQDTLALTQRLRDASPHLPPFIAVDQEGGRVTRLAFVSQLPAARQLAFLRPQTVAKIGRLLGQELFSLGFNLNFAPVMDVATRSDNPVIGDRSFSPDPIVVAKLGAALVDGLQSAGVSATAKHFPGHGDTRTDSHLTLPIVDHALNRLNHVELLPFHAAVHSKVDLIMVGHLHFPALDPTPNLPATLSYPIITELLRQQIGYDGLIITDAMNMRAVTDGFSSGQAAVLAFKAGIDIILMPADFSQAYSALLNAVKTDEISVSRLDESLIRILAVKQRILARQKNSQLQDKPALQLESVGSPSHRLWLEKLLHDRIELDAEPQFNNSLP